MHRSKNSTWFMIAIALFLNAWVISPVKGEETLTVDIGQPVYYESANGDRFVARYGSLSDGTLHFVKLKMPDGREYTLPQAVSGSGARYTNDREIVWWEHQGKIRVDIMADDGKWVTKYSDLKVVRGK
jgi:membrane-bound inhibitor of C-type lysozyme